MADRGLDGAVRALALASPLPVRVDIVLPGLPRPPVEAAGYRPRPTGTAASDTCSRTA